MDIEHFEKLIERSADELTNNPLIGMHGRQGDLVTIYDGPDYKVYIGYFILDESTIMPFLHMDVHKKTHNTYKKIKSHLHFLQTRCFDRPMFAARWEEDDETYFRFMTEFLGFTYLRDVPYYHGAIRHLYVLQPK